MVGNMIDESRVRELVRVPLERALVEAGAEPACLEHGGATTDVRRVLAHEQQHLAHVVDQGGEDQIRVVRPVGEHRVDDLQRVHELAHHAQVLVDLVDAHARLSTRSNMQTGPNTGVRYFAASATASS